MTLRIVPPEAGPWLGKTLVTTGNGSNLNGRPGATTVEKSAPPFHDRDSEQQPRFSLSTVADMPVPVSIAESAIIRGRLSPILSGVDNAVNVTFQENPGDTV
jgi:hypothetical protein